MTRSQREVAEDLARQFHAGLGGLAEVTNQSWRFFEGGDYQRNYIKPNHRLGHSLLTSREILALVTGFADLQTRTIRFAEACLAEQPLRLEPNMVIIVHADPDGDRKLRTWGRERGLTVLPVNGAPSLPQGTDLENALCSGLYKQDPFDLAGPVRSAHQFFGRGDVPDLARRLRDGHIQSLFGIRKIGKTSVLNRLLTETRQFHGMACAMVDCSDDGLCSLTAGQLLNSIAGAVNDAVHISEDSYCSTIPLHDDIAPAEAARVLVNILDRGKRPVLLLMDELDYITPSSPTAPQWAGDFNPFFRALRTAYQEACRFAQPFSIVISGVSSHWFRTEAIDGIENAALALVPEGYLPPFERAQSIQMIVALGRTAGLIFDEAVADDVATTCSDIPFWVRKAGSYIHSCYSEADRPLRVARDDVRALCEEFVEVEGATLAYSSLTHLFRIYPDLGSAAVTCTRDKLGASVSQPLLSALGRYGLIDENSDPSGPMVAAGLKHWEASVLEPAGQLPFSPHVVAGAGAIAPGSVSAAGEEEWAELLSEVSHRRNVLERSLRDLVLTVIRVEVGKKDDGRTPADVVLAALPSERRSLLAGKGASGVIKRTFWPELINIIKKNWPMFERVFLDRKQLELQGDIVNDRPDTHAKDFDGADLALQRRAISWFEERIEASRLL